MKRSRILSAIVVVIGLIILFLLIRTLVHAFTGKPKVTAPAKTQTSITQPSGTGSSNVDSTPSAAPAPTAANSGGSTPTPAPGKSANGTATTNLTNTGPGDVAMVTLAATATIGTMVLVRRRQLTSL